MTSFHVKDMPDSDVASDGGYAAFRLSVLFVYSPFSVTIIIHLANVGFGLPADPFRSDTSNNLFDVLAGSFCLLVWTFLLSSVIRCRTFCLHFATNFFCSHVFCPNLWVYLVPLHSVYLLYELSKVYLAVILKYFISSADILLVSLALMVQFSLPYNKAVRATVM